MQVILIDREYVFALLALRRQGILWLAVRAGVSPPKILWQTDHIRCAVKGVPFFGAAVSSSEFRPQDLSVGSGYYRGPVERRAIPTGILVALSVVLLVLFVLWYGPLSIQLRVKPPVLSRQLRTPL